MSTRAYGVAIEKIHLGDVVVIEDGRVRLATQGDLKDWRKIAFAFPDGINDVAMKVGNGSQGNA